MSDGSGRRERHRARLREYHRRRFERLVEVALRRLPREMKPFLDDVVIVSADEPTAEQRAEAGLEPGEDLFGLYEGVPMIEPGAAYHIGVPDRVFLFRRALEAACPTEADLVEEIRRTIVHEVAHHCGFEEDQLPY